MNIEVPRNFTGVFSIWIGVLHICVQLSRAKKSSSPLGKLHHERRIMNVRYWNITFIDEMGVPFVYKCTVCFWYQSSYHEQRKKYIDSASIYYSSDI